MIIVHCLAAVDVFETDEGDTKGTVEALLGEPGDLLLQSCLLLSVVFNYINLAIRPISDKVLVHFNLCIIKEKVKGHH